MDKRYLDPNIKQVILTKVFNILKRINKSDELKLLQYVRNLLNLCHTTDEVIYVTPKAILELCFNGYIPEIVVSDTFKLLIKDTQEKNKESAQLYKNLIVFYNLLKE